MVARPLGERTGGPPPVAVTTFGAVCWVRPPSAPLAAGRPRVGRYAVRMLEEAQAAPAPPPALHVRVRHGLRRPANWLQLVRFALVGASGYAVNLIVYALAL